MPANPFKQLPIPYPLPPMEAETAAELPEGDGWQYEPKWDGFRCIAFRDGDALALQSKNQKPLERYFPEVRDALLALRPQRYVLDGELVVPVEGRLDFDQLLQRIHPAASRIKKLSEQIPAHFIVFDLLVDERRTAVWEKALVDRRPRLEKFAARYFEGASQVHLSPASRALKHTAAWRESAGPALDGIIAKKIDATYRAGERDAVVKVKFLRTVDCVVGGFRFGKNGKTAGSLLLGLYDDDGLLHHVGYTTPSQRMTGGKDLTAQLEALRKEPGFTGRAPGGPSRWATERSTEWEPLKPELVVEVRYDHMTNGRFRHGAKFLRWRPDKGPKQCTFQQLAPPKDSALNLL